MARRQRLGELLIEAGLIDVHQLKSALAQQERWGNRLGANLVRMGFVDERELVRVLSRQLGLPVVSLADCAVQQEALEAVPAQLALKHGILPIALKTTGVGGTLVLAMEDPTDLARIDELSFVLGKRIEPVLAAPSELTRAIEQCYALEVEDEEGPERPEPVELPELSPAELGERETIPLVDPAADPVPARTTPRVVRGSVTPAPGAAAGTAPPAAPVRSGAQRSVLLGDARPGSAGRGRPPGPGAPVSRAAPPAAGPARRAQPPADAPARPGAAVPRPRMPGPPPPAPGAAPGGAPASTRQILQAVTQLLIEKGVLDRAEVVARVREIATRGGAGSGD